jgi:acyl carrier protein
MGLDAVEMMMGWEKAFDIQLNDAEVWELRTPRQAIDLIALKVGASKQGSGVYLGLRAYHRLRQAFGIVVQAPRDRVRLDSKLRQLLPSEKCLATWQTIFTQAGLPTAPQLVWGAGKVFWPFTIQDLVIWSVASHPRSLVSAEECWTRPQVRSVVRALMAQTLNLDQFNDDDNFVQDLGIS